MKRAGKFAVIAGLLIQVADGWTAKENDGGMFYGPGGMLRPINGALGGWNVGAILIVAGAALYLAGKAEQ